MIPVSDDFRVAVRRTHRMVVRVTTDAGDELPVDDGSVVSGLGTASSPVNLRTAQIVVPGYAWVPKDATAALAPFGQRLNVEIGVRTTQATEWCDFGKFLILSTSVNRPGGVVTVELTDPAYLVEQHVIEKDRTLSNAYPAIQTIQSIVGEVYPGVQRGRDDSAGAKSNLEELLIPAGTSGWEMCRRLAGSVGCTAGLDRDGKVELISLTPSGSAKELLDTGDLGVVTIMNSTVTRAGVVNRVVAYHSDQTQPTPVTVKATATQTTGPLAYGGPMGKLPRVITRGGLLAVSQAAAQAEADEALAAGVSRAREITLTTTPIPYLEAADVVDVKFPNGEHEMARIQSVSHGLSPEAPCQITARWLGDAVIGPMSARPSDFLAGEK